MMGYYQGQMGIHNYNQMRAGKLLLVLSAVGTTGFWTVTDQQKENIYGAYRSVVNSSRAGLILYRAIKDYQLSLMGLEYNSEEYHKARHQVHMRVATAILQLSKSNRGIYLKLGQYLGNLEKVVPWEFTHVLKVLQDSAPPIPYQELKVVIENDLHTSAASLFRSIDETAIASASLAQVHRGVLTSGEQVALKVQYPFLQVQSKWDLLVLGKITRFCNWLLNRNRKSDLDLIKLYQTWTNTLVEELDFNIQVRNALRTKELFKHNPHVYVPNYHTNICSERLIVMEFVQGSKINNRAEIQSKGIDPKKVASNLVSIFTEMIYKHRFIHCDAHPGNLLVRPHPSPLGHQIILLDHGLYREVSQQTVKDFSGLWVSLVLQDRKKVHQYAQRLNIHEHYQYLPLVFLHRSANSNKRIGEGITAEERQELRAKDLANFDSINNILQDLPPEIMFIIRASNLVGSHAVALGATPRQRLLAYTTASLRYFYGDTKDSLLFSVVLLDKLLLSGIASVVILALVQALQSYLRNTGNMTPAILKPL